MPSSKTPQKSPIALRPTEVTQWECDHTLSIPRKQSTLSIRRERGVDGLAPCQQPPIDIDCGEAMRAEEGHGRDGSDAATAHHIDDLLRGEE